MLDNVENRLLEFLGYENFIIIHRVLDNNIIKRLIGYKNKQPIEKLLYQCNDN